MSTGTKDEAEAWTRFGEKILEHRRLLLTWKNYNDRRLQGVNQQFEDSLYTLAPGAEEMRHDGSMARATRDGKYIVITRPGRDPEVVENERHDLIVLVGNDREKQEMAEIEARITKPSRDIDAEIVNHYKRGRSEADKRMLDGFMALLHETVPKRSLVTLQPEDVRTFIDALFATGNCTNSVKRKFALVNAMMASVIGHELFPMVKTNPFQIKDLIPHHLRKVVGKRRRPVYLDDEEIALIEGDIKNWADDQRALWTILRTMGARLDEPNQVTGSKIIKGYMTWEWGTKTEDGVGETIRRLPPPKAVLDIVGSRVTTRLFGEGGIFPRSTHVIINELQDSRLKALGITRNTGRSAQSLRHMCRTDLGNHGVHPRIVGAILGQAVDDLEYNRGEANQDAREGKSIAYRYDKGCSNPKPLFDAMNLIQGCF